MKKASASGSMIPSTRKKMAGASSAATDKGQGSVQIMEFEETDDVGSGRRKAIIFEKEFRRVIEKCTPGAPVAILAIAGKANKGKSLFLSFVLRYLNALKDGKESADWMGWDDKEERPLQGFQWANGYEVVTKGIWAWSEPISIKKSKGQVFDVLLLDTQGVFDEETSQREWNILAGFTLLTSSVMILNTSNDVQEDTLELLQNSLSFGLLALDPEKSPEVASKPFQNLVFLVRDWENHQQFPFGNEGGRKFIERKLEEKPRQDDSHRGLRRQMKKCFESIDCFVFPYPGDAVRESSFTGSLLKATKEYRLFAQHVQHCIEQLLNPNHIPLKCLNGNVLTGPDILEMFKSHIEIFNSDDLPSSSDLFNAAAHRCNAIIANRCETAFVRTFESSMSSAPFLDEEDFAKLQTKAKEEAMAFFKKSRKMGDSQVIAASKVELENKLDEKVSYFRAVNQNKLADARKILEENLTKILKDYEAELECKVGDDVLNQESFNDIHNQVASNARQKFRRLQYHPSLESEGLAMLDSEYENVERWVKRLKRNREMAQQAFSTFTDASAMEYWNTLSRFHYKDLKALEREEADARGKAFKALENFPRKLDGMTLSKVKNDLKVKFDAMYKKLVEPLEIKSRVEREEKEVQAAIEDAVSQYRNTMHEKISSASASNNKHLSVLELADVPLSTDSLANFHIRCENQALKYLSSFLANRSPQNATLLDEHARAQLHLRISQEFANFKRLNDKRLEVLEAQLSKFISKEQKRFTDDLQQLTNRFTYTSPSIYVSSSFVHSHFSFLMEANDLKDRVEANCNELAKAPVLMETDYHDRLTGMKSQMDNTISANQEVVELKRKEEAAARQAQAQTTRLQLRVERMQNESKEEEQRLREAIQARGDIGNLQELLGLQQRRLREAKDPCVVV